MSEAPEDNDLDDILDERGSVYGPFEENARIQQQTTDIWRASPGWATLSNEGRTALEQVALKVSRILSGDPTYLDNWDDIGGYTRRVARGIRARRNREVAKALDSGERERIPPILTPRTENPEQEQE